jgi:hypothetical protein
MKTTARCALAAILLTSSLAIRASAAPLDDAVAAGERGDYATALRLLQPLAEQGDRVAQYDLGIMHFAGQGVPENVAEATNWFRKAAEQGEPGAQYNLGVLYDRGLGVARSNAEALKWYSKSAGKATRRRRPISAACTTTEAACRSTMSRR